METIFGLLGYICFSVAHVTENVHMKKELMNERINCFSITHVGEYIHIKSQWMNCHKTDTHLVILTWYLLQGNFSHSIIFVIIYFTRDKYDRAIFFFVFIKLIFPFISWNQKISYLGQGSLLLVDLKKSSVIDGIFFRMFWFKNLTNFFFASRSILMTLMSLILFYLICFA